MFADTREITPHGRTSEEVRTEFYQLGKSTNEGQPEMGNNKFILLRELRGSKGLRQTAYADVYAESTRYPNAR